MPPEDDVLPAKEQPLPAVVSLTVDSPGYILESDPEEDPEEDDDEDPEEDPADYLNDRDDEEEEPSRDEADDEDEDDEEEDPTYALGFRAAMIRKRAESPSTSHSLLLPPPIILSYTRAPMAMMRVIVPSTYTLAPPSRTPPLLPIPLPTPSPPLLLPSTDRRADRHDTNEIYRRLDEAQDARAREARLSCKAWGWSMATSDDALSKVMALRTIVLDTGDSVGNKRILNCYYCWFKLQLLAVVTSAAQDRRKCSKSLLL
ncbi:hypothetical protein Tco_1377570, partial [Tanacetum coccineum]